MTMPAPGGRPSELIGLALHSLGFQYMRQTYAQWILQSMLLKGMS